jgi:hypothetical protein
MEIEFTAVETDQPATTTTAQGAKFKLEMMLLMLSAGRNDEAQQLLQQTFDKLNQLINDGH